MARTSNFQTREEEEHRSVNGVEVKAVTPYVLDTVTGNLTPQTGGTVPYAYDYIKPTYNSTTDVYKYYQGGSGGSLVSTVTITYTGTDKGTISSIART